jgi:hypothetical protein
VAERFSCEGAEIAREANAHIIELHARFHEVTVHAFGQDEDTIQLFCECGCIRLLASTPSDYSSNRGVWLEGHNPSG